MKILITGGVGFIGSNIAEEMKKMGYDVYIIDNFSPYYDVRIKEKTAGVLENKGVKIFRGDLNEDNIGGIFGDYDFIIHCAAQPGISEDISFEDYKQNNLIATYKVLSEALKIKNLKCFINISSSSVYGTRAIGTENFETAPISHYGVTKLAGEQLALSYARQGVVPACSLRLFSVYGERERPEKLIPRLINSALKNQEFTLYKGSENHIRSYTYVGDIVKGILSCINHYESCIGEIINLGSEKTHKTSECINMIENLLGKKIKIKIVPTRTGDQSETRAMIDKARNILKYAPDTDLYDGMRDEIIWFKEMNNDGIF